MSASALVLLGLVTGAPAAKPGASPAVAPGAFVGWFDAASRDMLDLPPSVRANAGRFQYVFVGGFWNERNPGYFVQNAQELKAMGVADSAIHFIFPSSDGTLKENTGYVSEAFHKVPKAGPIVVIAHSRGACDALTFALREPGFVRERVAAVFMVQGAFGGSGAADRVMGTGPEADARLGPVKRGVTNLLARRERASLNNGKNAGITDLTRDASRDYWEAALNLHRAALPVIGSKIYYLTTATDPSNRRVVQRAVASYLETYYGENDGVVALKDQSLPGVGTVLAVIDAGHSDLTHRAPSARASRRARRALMQSIVMAVGQTATGEGRD